MAAGDGSSSISVTVRVRPFTIREAAQLTKTDDGPLFLGDGSLACAPTPKAASRGIRPVIKVVDDKCLVFDPPEDNAGHRAPRSFIGSQGKRSKDKTFGFDRVFDENTTQGDVYEATTRNLLDSVLDGYNATVFAYGATGCGKTHTITGTAQQPGIIFLTMQELFERISETQSDKVTEITLSYLEIYNETIRDLLVEGGTEASSKSGLMLREDANQTISVSGLTSHRPQSVQEVMEMIMRGNEYRTMSPTEANATSSRSHAVLQINVSQKDRNADVNEPHTMATLSIIDLAGSERASATKNRGVRLTEGANINKSLLALGSCINALCDPRKRNHVPYRNSKLTRLLKFSLGGNCKTVMIVCVSPSSAHFDETQNTLRYADTAKNIQTKVTRNVYNVNRHVKDFLKKIDEQRALIDELKQQQKDAEGLAFVKFRKQTEKREAVIREGIARLRAAYDHSKAERDERLNNMRRLRQIERRIAMIDAWIGAFDEVCDIREEEEPPESLLKMKKTANGIRVELEQSRAYCHQRISKNNWQRAVETALQTGLKQLQEVDFTAIAAEAESLNREAELLKANAEREIHATVAEQEKGSETALVRILLQAHFETVAIVNQILCMDESDAVAAAKTVLHKMLTACTEATGHVIRPDGSMPIVEACAPSKSGTPKRKKATKLMGPSPKKPARLDMVREEESFAEAPKFSSPIRIRIGSAKKARITPRKKSPSKRAVRWRDDAVEGATLQDFSKTPIKMDSTPASSTEEVPVPSLPDFLADPEEVTSSSPTPPPSSTMLDNKPKSQRFQSGFLSRKPSPGHPILSQLASSPDPSPLSEMANNRASGRVPSSDFVKPKVPASHTSQQDENAGNHSSSDSDNGWVADRDEAQQIKKAMNKRTSLSRASSIRESTSRLNRRRSPGSVSNGSPQHENGLFSMSHARRMVKAEKDWDKGGVLSPRTTPVMKPGLSASSRRTTFNMSAERGSGRESVGPRSHSRQSSVAPGGSIGAQRMSMNPNIKAVWR